MTRKKIEEPLYVEASLKISKSDFVSLLEAQINKGEALLQINVPVVGNPSVYCGFYAHRSTDRVNYDDAAEKDFIAQYHRWHDYNVEIYKTSFTAANSTYRHDYEAHVLAKWGSNIIKEYKDEISRLINQMTADIEKIALIPCEIEEKFEEPASLSSKDTTSVFIVHGHDDLAINEVKVFLMKIGFNPIVLREKPNEGQTIIEKIEKYTNVGFAIVLYTPCDEGKAKESSVYKSRARQNVVFEHGYLCAKLGRKYVCALVKDDVEIPGDLGGVVYTPMNPGWEMHVARELMSAGYTFDASKLL